jgi:hypothetical protein
LSPGQAALLPPNPWFVVVLISLVPFATLGAIIVNWGSLWRTRGIISRACTGLGTALVALGLSEAIWQSLFGGAAPQLQLVVMLLMTAAGATIGTAPRVSDRLLRVGTWAMRHMRWVMIGLAVLVGGGLGYALTSGIALGVFTIFGVVLGSGLAVVLVLRIDRLIKQRYPHP